MEKIESNQICASKEDLEILKDASVYHIEDVILSTDDEDIEGMEMVFKLENGDYRNLSIYEDGTAYLSNKY